MLILKIWAAGFAVLVLVKIVMLLLARDAWLKLVDKVYGPDNRLMVVYGVAAVVVGLPVLWQVDIVTIGAVMLWMSLLVGLWLAPFVEIMPKLRDEVARMDFGRVWWLLVLWAALAVWMLAGVFRG